MILYELSRGLAYRQIRHHEMHWYTTTIPLVMTLFGAGAILALPSPPVLLGKDGLLASSLSVLSTLPGFYFAGLAAVATFQGLNMDAAMPSPAPSVSVRIGNVRHRVDLSRRQFLSYLFSYLVLLSFGLCMASIIANMAAPSLALLKAHLTATAVGQAIWTAARGVGVVTYVAAAASVVVTTLHGIFFLTERIHQP